MVLSPTYWPDYNPYMIDMGMASRGMDTHDLAKEMGVEEPVVHDLVEGNVEASVNDILLISSTLNYPVAFFKQYPVTQMDWDGKKSSLPKHSKIDYYARYKIMRGNGR